MTREELGALVAEWLHALDVCAALRAAGYPEPDQRAAWLHADELEERVRSAVAEDSERLYPCPPPVDGDLEIPW